MAEGRENIGMAPLSEVVSASIIDSYGDINRTYQLHTHWAARGLKKLYQENLPYVSRKVLLPVNKNTNTATLPIDFDYETFVGVIENGKKVALKNSPDLINEKGIEVVKAEVCPRCQQDNGICESLQVTESTKSITIEGNSYLETVIKKLYSNGDYYLETTTPVLNIETQVVEYTTKREFIVNFDLSDCGCLKEGDENVSKIQTYCPDVYDCYYVPCGCEKKTAGYRIFSETGLIQLEPGSGIRNLYVEYKGFLQKINGVYMVPRVAFETLVEYTKFKSIQGKPNISTFDKEWQKKNYREERRNMEKAANPASLSVILQGTRSLPKFNFNSI